MNKYRRDTEDSIDILNIDNTAVRQNQIKRIKKVKQDRDEKVVKVLLEKITSVAKSGKGNLLACAVDAARARATLGEISAAIEKISGRHKAVIRSVSGVYSENFSNQEEIRSEERRVGRD